MASWMDCTSLRIISRKFNFMNSFYQMNNFKQPELNNVYLYLHVSWPGGNDLFFFVLQVGPSKFAVQLHVGIVLFRRQTPSFIQPPASHSHPVIRFCLNLSTVVSASRSKPLYRASFKQPVDKIVNVVRIFVWLA